MRRFAVLLFILTIAVPARAEDWTTADGKTYKDVVVVDQEPDGVRITYDGGVGKIPYYELSDVLLKRFGQDPASLELKREAAQKAAADAALKAQQDAAEQKKEQDAAAAAAALNPPPTPTVAPKPVSPSPAPVPHPAPAPQNETATSASSSNSPSVPSNVAPTEENPYPHSKFQYDQNLDICDLDSFVVEVLPIPLDDSVPAVSVPGQGASLFLRIETEGHRAEAPDSITGTFVSAVPLKKLVTDRKVKFLVDGSYIAGVPPPSEDDGTPPPSPPLDRVVFVLTPEQMRAIILGKKLNFSVGSYDYRIDDAGMDTLRGYLNDVDHLPPPSTNLVRSYHRFLSRLPSIITVVSTTCEYIILGGFAIVVVASIAAFVMGLTRFIKM